MKKYLISSLESSANLHLSYVLEELKKFGDYEIVGIFDSAFAKPYLDSKEFNAMGFIEVLPLIFKAKRAIKKMVELSKECDAILLIDSPAFNLPLAKAIKKAGVKAPITYYILPQVWAWKSGRVKVVERYCDNLASILPFDKEFYNKSSYVGHPLLDEIVVKNSPNDKTIAFLPGSRRSEIERLMPIFRDVAKEFVGYRKILAIPPTLKYRIDEYYGDVLDFELSFDSVESLRVSQFAFICSGTATLQAALIATPFVLCFKARSLDIFLARKFVKLKHVGLANIIFDFMKKEPLHKEFIQNEVTKANLLQAYHECDREKFKKACDSLREYLLYGSAKNVAKLLFEES